MAPKRTSTYTAPSMTQAAIWQLVADSVTAAVEAQAANMENAKNTNRNPEPREAHATRKCSYKEFMSCQPFNFKGAEGAVKKMEDEFYNLTVKGNDLKTYVRRFQELETLCPTMMLNSEKMMEVFIGGLPQCIEGNVTASKPQTLEEAINISQRLIDQIIMVNIIPPDHVDDVPVIEPNQYDDVPVVLEHVLVDEDEDLKEEKEFKEEEEDDMEVDIEEDMNEPELTYPMKRWILLTLHRLLLSESSTDSFLREDSDSLLPGLTRRDINSLFGQMASLSRRLYGREMAYALVEKKGKAKYEYYGKLILGLSNEVRSSVEQGTTATKKLVERHGNVEDKVECKKLKKELEEASFSNTILLGFVFEERPDEAIDVLVKDKERTLKESQGESSAIHRMIKESVDVAIAAERARHENAGNDARASGPVGGQYVTPAVHECTFAGFIKCNPTAFHGTEGDVELRRWFAKIESVFRISECAEGQEETVNQMPWTKMKQLMTAEFCPIKEVQRMKHELIVEPDRVKFDAYIWGLTDNIKGEVTSSKPANLNEAVRMAHKIMPLKSAPLTQAAIRRMIKESVDVAITAERARHENAGNDARASGPVGGQYVAPAVHECTFAGFIKCNPTAFHGTEGAVELRRWFAKIESVFRISECAEGPEG
nr:reverse transcriptase domain-containing protein [Tanacetum cinerariifolium]